MQEVFNEKCQHSIARFRMLEILKLIWRKGRWILAVGRLECSENASLHWQTPSSVLWATGNRRLSFRVSCQVKSQHRASKCQQPDVDCRADNEDHLWLLAWWFQWLRSQRMRLNINRIGSNVWNVNALAQIGFKPRCETVYMARVSR